MDNVIQNHRLWHKKTSKSKTLKVKKLNIMVTKYIPPKFKVWFKKIGLLGFLFFLAKGIAWLVLGYFATRL